MSGIIDVLDQRLKAHSSSGDFGIPEGLIRIAVPPAVSQAVPQSTDTAPAGIFNVAGQLSTGRTSPVTYSGGRECLPSSFLVRPEEIIHMQRSLTAAGVNFVSLHSAVFCVQCELLSDNNTPRCLACGSSAMLSLSRLLGGSLRGQQQAHLIEDAELDRLVRSLLYSVPRTPAEAGRGFRSGSFFHSPSSAVAPSWTHLCAAYID